MYRWHACLSLDDERWLGMIYRDLFGRSGKNNGGISGEDDDGGGADASGGKRRHRKNGSVSLSLLFVGVFELILIMVPFCFRMTSINNR